MAQSTSMAGSTNAVDPGMLLAAIRERLPELRLLTDPIDRESYRYDETAYLKAGLPAAVALPTSTEEVAELVRLAAEHRAKVASDRVARSGTGGSARSAATTPPRHRPPTAPPPRATSSLAHDHARRLRA